MYYPQEIVEEVRARNDIVDVISGYVHLQKKGASYIGLCPFHNEKTPSFSVSSGKQMFYCFGCGVGGTVISFLQHYENMEFLEALKALADRAGVKLPEKEYSEEAKKQESRRVKLLAINKEAAKYFYYQLRAPQGKLGLTYLKDRQLSDETIHKFGLGFANKTTDDLARYLKEKNFPDDFIKEAGLATFTERAGWHDKFWNRVIFPIQDINHRVIGFGGRVMGGGEPKYLNSPETPVFDKSKNLYGLNFARSSRKNQVILCEGYMDVITLHQAGFTQAVASLGTAFTEKQAVLLRRYADEVLLAYDSDGAGVKAALRAIGILREAGLTGRVINFAPYKDPDEFIKAQGAEAFEKRLEEAENSFFFEIRVLSQAFDLQDPAEKTKFHREIAKKLCGFPEEAERANYIEAIAEKYHIGHETLRKLVSAAAAQTELIRPVERAKSGIQQKKPPEDNIKQAERLLLGWIAEYPDIYPKIKNYITAADFTDELYRKAAGRLFAEIEEGKVNLAGMMDLFTEEEEQKEIAKLFHTDIGKFDNQNDAERALHDMICSVKRNSYEYYSKRMGTDISALDRVIAGKKALEELSKMYISLN